MQQIECRFVDLSFPDGSRANIAVYGPRNASRVTWEQLAKERLQVLVTKPTVNVVEPDDRQIQADLLHNCG